MVEVQANLCNDYNWLFEIFLEQLHIFVLGNELQNILTVSRSVTQAHNKKYPSDDVFPCLHESTELLIVHKNIKQHFPLIEMFKIH